MLVNWRSWTRNAMNQPRRRSKAAGARRRKMSQQLDLVPVEVQDLEPRVLLAATATNYVPGRVIVAFDGSVAVTMATSGKAAALAEANDAVQSYGLSNGKF